MPDNPFAVDFKTSESPVKAQEQSFKNLNQGFSNFVNSRESIPALQEKYDQQYGVPQMQQQLQTGMDQFDALGNQIRGVGRDIQQGSQESILTQGQLNRMTQARQEPMLEQQAMMGQNLSRLGQNLGTAQSNVNQSLSLEQAENARLSQPWMQQYNTESILSAARMTGWSQENSNELQRLLANQQAGLTWSNAEAQRAHDLSMQENAFENQMKAMQEEYNRVSSAPQFMSIGEGSSVINPLTGELIYKSPKTYASSSKTTNSGNKYIPDFGE